jgi:hypothetical protein
MVRYYWSHGDPGELTVGGTAAKGVSDGTISLEHTSRRRSQFRENKLRRQLVSIVSILSIVSIVSIVLIVSTVSIVSMVSIVSIVLIVSTVSIVSMVSMVSWGSEKVRVHRPVR